MQNLKLNHSCVLYHNYSYHYVIGKYNVHGSHLTQYVPTQSLAVVHENRVHFRG